MMKGNCLQTKMDKKKEGVSLMIGYILLVTITIIISTLVYQQLKTYVPTDSLQCSDGVSAFIDSYSYDCNNKNLSVTIKNNGRFGIAGYFASATDSPNKTLATNDISKYTGFGKGGAVILDINTENSLNPGDKKQVFFGFLSAPFEKIYSLEIIPIRYENINGRKRIVSCTDSRISQKISCNIK